MACSWARASCSGRVGRRSRCWRDDELRRCDPTAARHHALRQVRRGESTGRASDHRRERRRPLWNLFVFVDREPRRLTMFIVVLIFVLAYYGTILTGENKVVAYIALVLTILY